VGRVRACEGLEIVPELHSFAPCMVLGCSWEGLPLNGANSHQELGAAAFAKTLGEFCRKTH